MKSTYVFDNHFLCGQGHERLTPEYGVMALDLLERAGGLEADGEYSANKFLTNVCLPLRVVELWVLAQRKKFGHVATKSSAFHRVVAMLQTLPGLAKVKGQCPAPLHGKSDTDRGIEECHLIVKAMERCKAGGHGPPVSIETPTEPEEAGSGEGGTGSAGAGIADTSNAGSSSSSTGNDKDAAEVCQLEALANALCGGAPLDSEQQQAARKAVSIYDEITYISTMDALVEAVGARVAGNVPMVVLVDAATSRHRVVTDLVALAGRVCQKSGSGALRVIVTVNRRFGLMCKVEEKVKEIFPKYHVYCVPLTSKRQSDRMTCASAQEFVFVVVPPGDKRGVPAAIAAGPAKAVEQVRLRCTERECPFRPAQIRAGLSAECTDPTEEIDPEDKDDFGADFLLGMAMDAQEPGDEEMPELPPNESEAETAKDDEKKKDYIVDLWPFARSQDWFRQVYNQLGCSTPGTMCCILTTSAHPGPAVCAKTLKMDTVVFQGRMKAHSLQHGHSIGRHMCYAQANADGRGVKRGLIDENCFIRGPTLEKTSQVVQIFDAPAAADGNKAWYEGLNLYFTSDDLEGLVVSLCNKEMTGGRVALTSTREGFGRGLEMRVSVKEAEKIIDVPALWYDSLDSLRKFLAMKGNEYWATRVVKIDEQGCRRCEFGDEWVAAVGELCDMRVIKWFMPIFVKMTDPMIKANFRCESKNFGGIVTFTRRWGTAAPPQLRLTYKALAATEGGSSPGNWLEEDRRYSLVRRTQMARIVEGVAKGDGETDMYAVMVGCAQYTNHYHCIKKFANARLKFYPEKGFTAGALVLEASSRNSTGLAAGSEVLINYGVSVSTDEDTSFGPDAKRFKGALDTLFARQLDGEKNEAENKAKDEAEAKAKAEAEKKAQEEAERKAKEDAAKLAGAGAGTTDVLVCELKDLPGKLVLRAGKFVIICEATGNKKIAPKKLLKEIQSGKFGKTGDGQAGDWTYEMSSSSTVYSKTKGEAIALGKLIKDQHPTTKEVWSYQPFAKPGALPKSMAKKKDMAFFATDRATAPAIIAAGKNCKSMAIVAVVRFAEASSVIEPTGLALISMSQIVVKPGENPVA